MVSHSKNFSLKQDSPGKGQFQPDLKKKIAEKGKPRGEGNMLSPILCFHKFAGDDRKEKGGDEEADPSHHEQVKNENGDHPEGLSLAPVPEKGFPHGWAAVPLFFPMVRPRGFPEGPNQLPGAQDRQHSSHDQRKDRRAGALPRVQRISGGVGQEDGAK